jgi:hypothetical protein
VPSRELRLFAADVLRFAAGVLAATLSICGSRLDDETLVRVAQLERRGRRAIASVMN